MKNPFSHFFEIRHFKVGGEGGWNDPLNVHTPSDRGGLGMPDPLGLHANSRATPPGSPDYIGAANAQSLGTIGASMVNNVMSHPDINTPLGSQNWQKTGVETVYIPGIGNINVPQYRQNVTLSPEQQSLYQQHTGLSSGLYGQAGANLGSPSDLSSVQALNDKAYSALTSRLDPQWAQREQMQKTALANQGLTAGGEAYDAAMRDFNQGRNDAYQQANLAAIQTMPQTLSMANTIRDQPLNELNALRTGSQVNMPSFQPTQYSMGAQGPNTMQALQGQSAWQQGLYNQQVQQQNNQTQGLVGLGAAFFSDRRLKSNIVKVGDDARGFGIYDYDLFGKRQRGVMADEVERVLPDVVVTMPNGYKAVYYGRL